MNKFVKNIFAAFVSFLLLLSISILFVLWNFSNDIPDYKFLKSERVSPPLPRPPRRASQDPPGAALPRRWRLLWWRVPAPRRVRNLPHRQQHLHAGRRRAARCAEPARAGLVCVDASPSCSCSLSQRAPAARHGSSGQAGVAHIQARAAVGASVGLIMLFSVIFSMKRPRRLLGPRCP